MWSVAVARKGRFKAHELREIERILIEFQADILAAWQTELRKRENR